MPAHILPEDGPKSDPAGAPPTPPYTFTEFIKVMEPYQWIRPLQLAFFSSKEDDTIIPRCSTGGCLTRAEFLELVGELQWFYDINGSMTSPPMRRSRKSTGCRQRAERAGRAWASPSRRPARLIGPAPVTSICSPTPTAITRSAGRSALMSGTRRSPPRCPMSRSWNTGSSVRTT